MKVKLSNYTVNQYNCQSKLIAMLPRDLEIELHAALDYMPVVALLGPRQVGKTTMAIEVANKAFGKEARYLDLELASDLSKLTDAESYLRRYENKLLIIDEVQRRPDLFPTIRALVDVRKRSGERNGMFLLLGSASRDLLQQSSESLAGRIRYLELCPFSAMEVHRHDPLGYNHDKLWMRGGFPDSYLAANENQSWQWRGDFIASYVERDIPMMGPQVPATKMRRFWSMLAHYHGQQVVHSELAKSLEVSHTTIRTYLDILTDFYMVRQVPPWPGNTSKRLVKSPKVYIRDTGLLHRLLNLPDMEALLGHPVVGASWEGFVAENIITNLTDKWAYSYYRTSSQSEIDLVLEGPSDEVWAIEIKKGIAPSVSKGYYSACDDVKATKKLVVYAGNERYPLKNGVEAIGLIELLEMLKKG